AGREDLPDQSRWLDSEGQPVRGARRRHPGYLHRGQPQRAGPRPHPGAGPIWGPEHGPMGGDELNVLKLGHNYGWPVISYGIDYDGKPITDLTEKDGMDQPVKYWKPSPALS